MTNTTEAKYILWIDGHPFGYNDLGNAKAMAAATVSLNEGEHILEQVYIEVVATGEIIHFYGRRPEVKK